MRRVEKYVSWLTSRLDLSRKELPKLVSRSMGPNNLLRIRSVENFWDPRITWMEERLGLDTKEALRKLFLRTMVPFSQSPQTLETKFIWVRDKMQVDDDQLARILRRAPKVLDCKITTSESKCRWLQQRLGLNDGELAEILRRHPPNLAYSTENKVEPLLNWLQERFELHNEGLGSMILLTPNKLLHRARR